jgi:hypothetical protein
MLMGDSDIRQNDGCECDSCIRHCGLDPQSLQEKEAFWTPSYQSRIPSGVSLNAQNQAACTKPGSVQYIMILTVW